MSQQLATKDEFFIWGILQDRVPEVLHDPEDTTIDSWLLAASAQVLRVFASFMELPLVEWGEDVKQWVCVLAAWHGKAVLGLPASEPEYDQLLTRYEQVIKELEEIRVRREAPAGVVDSSTPEEDDYYPGVNRIVGYEKADIDMW